MPVICEGCGQRVPIPLGYRRNKIQCACGVICSVPESARQEAEVEAPKRPRVAPEPSAVEEDADLLLRDDETASPPADIPRLQEQKRVAKTRSAPKPAVTEKGFPCRRCRRLVRRQGECPDCDGAAIPPELQEELASWPSVDGPEVRIEDEEEDSSPYTVEGADDVKCPNCTFMLPPGSVLCVRCGFHLEKRKKIDKTFQPIERDWETNVSLTNRVLFYIGCSVAFFVSGLIGVLNGGVGLATFIFIYLLVTTMAAFAFGTFDRIHLIRDTRGRVNLTKYWRVCFVPLQPQRINVHSYEGVASGRHRDISMWEYWIFFFLFIGGIIPGIVWWYLVIYKVQFHVSLSRDHGYPAYIVYSGWSEMQMKEIAYSVRDASGLPYNES